MEGAKICQKTVTLIKLEQNERRRGVRVSQFKSNFTTSFDMSVVEIQWDAPILMVSSTLRRQRHFVGRRVKARRLSGEEVTLSQECLL